MGPGRGVEDLRARVRELLQARPWPTPLSDHGRDDIARAAPRTRSSMVGSAARPLAHECSSGGRSIHARRLSSACYFCNGIRVHDIQECE